MKKMRKMAAFLLAMIMILAMGMTAFAAEGDCKITISSPNENATYTAYKVFDVDEITVGTGDTAKKVASYTRPADAKELPEVPDTLFEVVNNGGKVYYNPVGEVAGSELEAYLSGINWAEYALDSASGKTEITGLEPGYYYVVSSTGQATMLRAVAGEETVITAKDTDSSWGEGGKRSGHFVMKDTDNDPATPDEEVFEQDSFFAIGENVDYEISYKGAQNYTRVTENKDTADEKTVTTKVYQYVAEDEMKGGLALNADSIKVEIKEKGAAEYRVLNKVNALPEKTDGTFADSAEGMYTVVTEGAKFTIVIPWANSENPENVEDFYYNNVPAEIRITYSATVTADVEAGKGLENKATINPNDGTADTGKTINVYTGSIDVLKYDSSNLGPNATEAEIAAAKANTLAGAVFVVTKTEKETVEDEEVDVTYYLTKVDGKISWTKVEKEALELTTGADGKFVGGPLKGLDKGTYALVEKAAPAGYNLLANPVPFEIAKDDATTTVALVLSEDIGNNTGAVLPSTGGIGTTIFYVVGGIMVLGACVLLITKKRMSARN